MLDNVRLERNAYRGFVPFMAAFLLCIFTGYYFTLSTVQPSMPPAGVVAEAIAILAVIGVLLRMTAMSIFRSRQSATGGGAAKYLWFLGLFVFSGYGVFSAVMLFFEGPVIIKEAMVDSNRDLAILAAVAEDSLRLPAYQAMVDRVRAQQAHLREEILNPAQGRYCGVGDKAKTIIDAIAKDLPGFSVLSGTEDTHDCRDKKELDGIYQSYAHMIDRGIDNHPLAAALDKGGRDRLLASIRTRTRADSAELTERENTLAGISTLIANLDLYADSVRTLERIANDYASMRQGVIAYDAAAAVKMPDHIDLSVADDLVSGLRILHVVMVRYNRPTSYVYPIAPLVADWLASMIASLTIAEHLRVRRRVAARRQAFGVDGSDVTYLWVPPADV